MTDVLISAEDPGAANFMAAVPGALAQCGFRSAVVAGGQAPAFLEKRGIVFERAAESSASDILDRWRPRVLLAGTADSGTLGTRLIAEARARGITTVAGVDARFSADHRFRGPSGDPLEFAPDWVLVPDQWTREAFLAIGCSPERVLAVGQPHLDHVRSLVPEFVREGRAAIRTRLFGNDLPGRRVVLFIDEPRLSGSQGTKDPAQYTLHGRGKATGRTQIVLDEFLDSMPKGSSRPYLVFRIHPRSSAEDYKDHLSGFDFISKGGSGPEVVFAADLVVGMTSMLLLEAATMGLPTLSIVPDRKEAEYLPSVAARVTPMVDTREQLRSILPAMLDQTASAAEFDWAPAGAVSRIVGILASLLESTPDWTIVDDQPTG